MLQRLRLLVLPLQLFYSAADALGRSVPIPTNRNAEPDVSVRFSFDSNFGETLLMIVSELQRLAQ